MLKERDELNDRAMPVIELRRSVVLRVYLLVIAVFAGLHLALSWLYDVVQLRPLGLGAFYRMVRLDAEANLPTYFSALNLLLAGALAACLGMRHGGRGRFCILGVAVLLTVMSVDEACIVHEMLGYLLRDAPLTGWLSYRWYVIALPLFLIAVAPLAWSARHIPGQLRDRLIVCMTLFLVAAVGIELIEAKLNWEGLPGNFVAVAIEESVEMFAVIWLIDGLLREHLGDYVSIKFLP